jgi:hypothetical protein
VAAYLELLAKKKNFPNYSRTIKATTGIPNKRDLRNNKTEKSI